MLGLHEPEVKSPLPHPRPLSHVRMCLRVSRPQKRVHASSRPHIPFLLLDTPMLTGKT